MLGTSKLKVVELQILKKEEETIRKLLSKYKNTLNALKVEELTLCKQLGTTQDRARQSRNNTPTAGLSRPHSSLRPKSSEAAVPSDQKEDTVSINRRTLNLSAVPLINRMLQDHMAYEEEEEDDDDEEMEEDTL